MVLLTRTVVLDGVTSGRVPDLLGRYQQFPDGFMWELGAERSKG